MIINYEDKPAPECHTSACPFYNDRIEEARRLIARAIEIMTPDQVVQWEGVRAWQELAGED